MSQKKRLFSTCLVIALLLTLFPGAAGAGNQPAVSLEQAIQKVKQNFTVPANLTNFTSNFSNSDSQYQYWYLDWNDPSGNAGDFSARVDAVTGEIVSINIWKPDNKTGSKIPVISVDDAQKTGTQLLNRLAPTRASSMQLLPDNRFIPLTSYAPPTYTMRWQRMANNIPVASDFALIEINMADGQLISYHLNWTNLDMPSPARVISPEAARQSFDKAGMLQLQYLLPTSERPLDQNSPQPKPFLAYRIYHPSSGIIDALTGSPVLPEENQWLRYETNMAINVNVSGMGKSAATADKVSLTPEENQEVEQSSILISQEKAIAAVTKWVEIPGNLRFRNASLYQDWQNRDIRVWNLNWDSNRQETSAPFGFHARVNALNGELISFNLDLPRVSGDKKVALDREKARQLAENFIKQVQPQRFQQVKLDETFDPYRPTLSEKDSPEWALFHYQRKVNGIDCMGNGISVTIDKASQQIIAYTLDWADREFPPVQNVLGINRAADLFLKEAPLTLTYAASYGPEGPRGMRLVYQPIMSDSRIDSGILDAYTGQRVDWQGKPVAYPEQADSFNDIAGSWAEKEISLLGQAGLFREYGAAFHPDEPISLVSLLRAMLSAKDGINSTHNLNDQEIMKRAQVKGWIKETATPSPTIDREMLARLMVSYLGLDYAANIQGIYQVPYKDAGKWSADLKGYAALAWGLGVIKGNGISFDPRHVITRAEAAAALVHTLQVKTQP